MHRIDTKTAQKDKFGAGKNGFTRGNPQTGTPATDLDDDYFDMLQEELCSVVEASGASLEKGRHDQLLTALRALLLSRKNPFGDIKSDGTVKTALENLGLGETVKLAANAFQVKESALTIDLNTLYDFSSAGVYFQSLDENATSEHHYPIKEAGTLLVTPSAYGCQQEYTAFGSGRKFVRGLETTGGPWKPWTEFYGTNHKPTPADIGALASNAVAVAAAKLSVARLINGVSFDGSKDINLPLLGHGQSWVDVTSQRSVGVTYTNTTGRPIQILLDFVRPTASWSLNVVIDGLTSNGAGGYCPIIPPGSTYMVSASGINTVKWRELR